MRWLEKGERKFITLFAGILALLFGLLRGYAAQEEYRVERDGVVVTMQIVNKPDCGTNKGNRLLYFSYDNEVYKKNVSAIFCKQSMNGDLIAMKYLPGSKIILFPLERTFQVFYLAVGCILLGLFLIGSHYIGMSTPVDR